MELIIFKNEDNSIGIVVPTNETLLIYSLKIVALKDVPSGLPFWMVEGSEIPSDRTFRDAWEISETMREPDGYGSPFNTFSEILENEIEDAEFEEVPDDNNQPE